MLRWLEGIEMTTSDGIAITSCIVSLAVALYTFARGMRAHSSDGDERRRDAEEHRLDVAENRLTSLEAQLSVIVGGIQRMDARMERIEAYLLQRGTNRDAT